MLSTSSRQRSPEEINHAIRRFLSARSGRALTGAERRMYERLRAEWAAASRRGPCGRA
ncbi:hypothetical protein [Streptomyces albireticuli]|uniref:hypothetical protein n=1 Tax=Streptomyces albireticuli TaxID=1940 RepID=UPI0014746E61|nr:hypothetical protein [Streptomyces albireticuli]MCD9141939.1 hypothetical protein [Streptomyces albireticuli]MCD9163117.1 hypothetical protein [Streptomyces albireticuli]MCD9190113.1 hypothetical protein [Streptomyces albireticuli]